jgi:hypothetical protein
VVVKDNLKVRKEDCMLYKGLTLDTTDDRRKRSILVKRKTIRLRKQRNFEKKPTVFKYKRWSFKTSLAPFELIHVDNEDA